MTTPGEAWQAWDKFLSSSRFSCKLYSRKGSAAAISEWLETEAGLEFKRILPKLKLEDLMDLARNRF